jgi:hypothetical protein
MLSAGAPRSIGLVFLIAEDVNSRSIETPTFFAPKVKILSTSSEQMRPSTSLLKVRNVLCLAKTCSRKRFQAESSMYRLTLTNAHDTSIPVNRLINLTGGGKCTGCYCYSVEQEITSQQMSIALR